MALRGALGSFIVFGVSPVHQRVRGTTLTDVIGFDAASHRLYNAYLPDTMRLHVKRQSIRIGSEISEERLVFGRGIQ
jgi:hypothetical protein